MGPQALRVPFDTVAAMPGKWPLAFPLGVVLLFLLTTVGVALIVTDAGRYIPSPLPVPVAFDRIASGDGSGVGTKGYRIVESAAEWDRLVAASPGLVQAGAPSRLDPRGRQVLAVFEGQEPSSGYSVRVTSVTKVGTEILVRLRETSPGVGCIVSQSPTQPFDVVSVPKVDGTFVFLTQHSTHTCS